MKSFIITVSLALSLFLSACGGKNEGTSDSAKDSAKPQQQEAAIPTGLTEQQRADLFQRAQNAQISNRFTKLNEVDYANMILEYENCVGPLYQSRNKYVGNDDLLKDFYQNSEVNEILNEVSTYGYVLDYAAGSGLYSDALIQRWNEVSNRESAKLAKMLQEKERLENSQNDSFASPETYPYFSEEYFDSEVSPGDISDNETGGEDYEVNEDPINTDQHQQEEIEQPQQQNEEMSADE